MKRIRRLVHRFFFPYSAAADERFRQRQEESRAYHRRANQALFRLMDMAEESWTEQSAWIAKIEAASSDEEKERLAREMMAAMDASRAEFDAQVRVCERVNRIPDELRYG